MKKKTKLNPTLFAALLSVSCLISYAQTDIPGGDVYGTWLKSNSPYHINGDITIPNDSTLTVEHGVRVEFTGLYKLDVQGTLLAEGLANDSIVFTVTDTSGFYNNTHTGWQGIQFASTLSTNDSSRLVYCIIEYGKSVSSSGPNGDPDKSGGGLYIWGFSKIYLYGIEVRFCRAYSLGGGIFITNQAPGVNVTLLYSKIHHNALTGCCWGGGIYAQGDFNLIGSQLTENSSGHGGGLYMESGENLVVGSSVISNNTAAGYGGGIYLLDIDNAFFDNTLISNNSAINKGGGLYFESSNAFILNNTITNNFSTDAGGGIYSEINASYSDTVMNTIVWGNVATNADSSVAGDVIVTYSDIERGYTGEGNINSDPLFMVPSAGAGSEYSSLLADWSLQASSPCINSGNPELNYTETDLTGFPRVDCLSDTIDMGAYEFVPEDVMPTVENATVHISENVTNNTIVHTVTGTNVLYFSIIAGNTDNAFSLDSITGVIRVSNEQVISHATTPFFELIIGGYNNCASAENLITIFVDEEVIENSLETQIIGDNIIIYPNPVSDILNLQFNLDHTEKINIAVYNCRGQLVRELFSDEMPQGHHQLVWQLNCSVQYEIPSSVYLLHFKGETFTTVIRFIKE